MSGCTDCSGCKGGCSGCGGCPGAGSLELTQPEVDFLRLLGQVAFLPIARRMGDETPVCLENGLPDAAQTSRVLLMLERKALVSLDYREPLKGAAYERYAAYPVQGSVALTARGIRVLEVLEYQGIHE